jgi:hypothetical protein
VKNNLPGATGGADSNQITMNSFAVDIGPSQFGALPPNVATLFDTLNRAPRNSADYALLHYSVPGRQHQLGRRIGCHARRRLPRRSRAAGGCDGRRGVSRSSMIVNAHIRAFGSTDTQDYESDPLDFPIYVCAGCLVASVLNCPVPSDPPTPAIRATSRRTISSIAAA